MRHGRAKAARKTLQFFRLSVGISPPYQLILDGTFLVAMIAQKVPLRDRLDRTLQHQQFSLQVTRSSLDELEKLFLANKNQSFKEARQWGLDYSDRIIERVDIPESADANDGNLGIAGSEILNLIQSKPQHFVCSQDETLLDSLRALGTTPLIRLSRGVLLLENPSKSSVNQANYKEKAKWSIAGSIKEHERKLVDQVKQAYRQDRERVRKAVPTHARVKHKAKGPNPLSCKKRRPASGHSKENGERDVKVVKK